MPAFFRSCVFAPRLPLHRHSQQIERDTDSRAASYTQFSLTLGRIERATGHRSQSNVVGVTRDPLLEPRGVLSHVTCSQRWIGWVGW